MVVVPGVEDLELLAAGNNGSVYAGVESGLDRRVAVKVMLSGLDGGHRRFEREVKAMGRLSRIDAVAPIHRTGVLENGQPFLVMPLFERSLQDVVRDNGPMKPELAVRTVRRAAEAIAQTHEMGVLHLDLKPSNLLLDDTGTMFVADFGIAEFTDSTASMSGAMLTPQFAPPERFQDVKPSAASDVYSLGATLFALLTGQPPFKTEENTGPSAVMLRIIQDQVPTELLPDGLAGHVKDAISTAMSKDPAQRPSAHKFAEMLVDTTQTTASASTPAPTTDEVWVGADVPTVRGDSGFSAATQHNDARTVVLPPEVTTGGSKRGLLIAAGAVAIVGLVGVVALLGLRGDDELPIETAKATKSDTTTTETARVTTTKAPTTTINEDAIINGTTSIEQFDDEESPVAPSTETEPDFTTQPVPDTSASTQSTQASVFDLRAGDCIVGDIDAGQVTKVEKVDCEGEHQFEVYREALIELSITTFDETAISAYAEDVCRTSLAAYVPADDDRNLKFKFLQPTEDSWNQAEDPDRVITCLLFDGDGDPLIGRAN